MVDNPDIFTQLISYKIAGIPVFPVIVIAGIVYLIYYLLKRSGGMKIPRYKKRELKKEIRDYNYQDIRFGFPVNKLLVYFSPIKYVISSTFHTGKPKIVKDKFGLKIDYSKTNEVMRELKVRQLGMIGYIKAMFGFGIDYIVVNENLITENEKEMKINKNSDYSIDNGVYVFSDTAKEVGIEHIAYLKNRENELEALVNWYPRMIYTAEITALKTAELQEKARIEAEKYKGQTDE